MPSPSPATRPKVTPPKSRGNSSAKSAPVSKASVAASKARAAFDRTVEKRPSLPLDAAGGGDPAREGLTRLRGAYLIELSHIQNDPTQPRKQFDEQALTELADSIRRHGVIQPISVRYLIDEKVYRIISGERRYQASKLAGLETIPCVIHQPEDREVLGRQLVENWQRAQLHPFEIADSLAALRDANGYSQKQLALEIGKREAEISKFLKLLDLSPAAQKEGRSDPTGALSFRHLYSIARLEPDEQVSMVAAVQQEKLTVVATEERVKKQIARRQGVKRGRPVTKVEYVTTKAKLTLVFRQQSVEKQDILAALNEARDIVNGKGPKLNIVRAK
jgi:ParB family chromosome partitioning protein